MKLDSKARKYASAVFSVAEASGAVEEVYTSLKLVNKLVKEDPAFRVFLLSKRISGKQKAEVVATALGTQCHGIVSSLIGLVDVGNLVRLIQDIEQAFSPLYMSAMNLVYVTAHVAETVTEEWQDALKQTLEKILGKSADLKTEVDPSLLGGIKLRIGNLFLDASIKNGMKSLRQDLLET